MNTLGNQQRRDLKGGVGKHLYRFSFLKTGQTPKLGGAVCGGSLVVDQVHPRVQGRERGRVDPKNLAPTAVVPNRLTHAVQEIQCFFLHKSCVVLLNQRPLGYQLVPGGKE
jgi:hypothetical protein